MSVIHRKEVGFYRGTNLSQVEFPWIPHCSQICMIGSKILDVLLRLHRITISGYNSLVLVNGRRLRVPLRKLADLGFRDILWECCFFTTSYRQALMYSRNRCGSQLIENMFCIAGTLRKELRSGKLPVCAQQQIEVLIPIIQKVLMDCELAIPHSKPVVVVLKSEFVEACIADGTAFKTVGSRYGRKEERLDFDIAIKQIISRSDVEDIIILNDSEGL